MRTYKLSSLLTLAAAAGVASLLSLLFGPEPERAWRILLVNFILVSTAAIGAVAWSAIFELANARWPAIPRKMAGACTALLPLSLLLFLLLWFGRQTLFLHLDSTALFAREAVALLVVYSLGYLFAKRAALGGSATGTLSSSRRFGIIFSIVYACAQTLFSWDFLMWLDPHWTSTLFGGFHIVSGLYAGLAILALLSVANRIGQAADGETRHNLGKLLFSFSLLWVYFFWSQYLVIWYGNLPREIGYVLSRSQQPWSTLAVLALLMNFVVPFLLLLPRAAKQGRFLLGAVSAIVLAGVGLQFYLLATPALTLQARFGWQEAVSTAGVLALSGIMLQLGWNRFVAVQGR